MTAYASRSDQALQTEIKALEGQLAALRDQKLALNMTRGKPAPEQLDLLADLASCLGPDDHLSETGVDCRNYGGAEGLWEMRSLFADLLGTRPESVWALGSSSLTLMYDLLVRCLLFTLPDGQRPWQQENKPAFICPVPGYDRHFFATESLGFDLITVAMTPDGPDMAAVEALVADNPRIKGMWCVPQYSNPQGVVYSQDTCQRLSAMKTAAPDFRLFWDHAYVVHHLDPDRPAQVPDILSLCRQQGQANRPFVFASTSKITWAGSGVACLAASPDNLAFIRRIMAAQAIGPDKMNQLRHARFLKNKETVMALMARHAALLAPKFECVHTRLQEGLSGLDICSWTKPGGGYFFSLDLLPGTAAETVRLAASCGIELTPAGSTWPGRRDPLDSNIRLAPSFPSLADLEIATGALVVCIRLAAARHILAGRAL